MRVRPAIDIRDGACVQLVGGMFASEALRIDDPVAVARGFIESGFTALHVVDLNAAKGAGSNRHVIAELLELGVDIEVGGGVRDDEALSSLLDLGASRVVVGTRAVEDPTWLQEIAEMWPNRIVVAADVRDRSVLTRGWDADSHLEIDSYVRSIEGLPLAGILLTAVHVEGQLAGPDTALYETVGKSTGHSLIASGGITTNDHVAGLDAAGVSEVVIGMALYKQTVDADALVRDYV